MTQVVIRLNVPDDRAEEIERNCALFLEQFLIQQSVIPAKTDDQTDYNRAQQLNGKMTIYTTEHESAYQETVAEIAEDSGGDQSQIDVGIDGLRDDVMAYINEHDISTAADDE